MFTANLYCNKKPYANYIGKWNRATSTLHKSARTASKTKRGIFKNYFLFIILTINERMVFCLYDISDMINQVGDADLKNNDIFIKTPAIEIRKSLLHVDFGLIASVMHTSSSSLGKKQKFRTFLSCFL